MVLKGPVRRLIIAFSTLITHAHAINQLKCKDFGVKIEDREICMSVHDDISLDWRLFHDIDN